MLQRLVDRLWRWQNARHDPDAVIACLQCKEPLRRGDAVAKVFDTEACALAYQETVQGY